MLASAAVLGPRIWLAWLGSMPRYEAQYGLNPVMLVRNVTPFAWLASLGIAPAWAWVLAPLVVAGVWLTFRTTERAAERMLALFGGTLLVIPYALNRQDGLCSPPRRRRSPPEPPMPAGRRRWPEQFAAFSAFAHLADKAPDPADRHGALRLVGVGLAWTGAGAGGRGRPAMSEEPASRQGEGLAANLTIIAMFWAAGTAWAWFNLRCYPGFHPVERGLVFNEMLTQLMRGRFDVNPATIGWEGFVRGGRTYAYFGIFCALLRAPLLIVGDIRTTDITAASLLVATSLSLACRLGVVAVVFARASLGRGLAALRTVALIAAAFSGETVQFLRPSIYQKSAFPRHRPGGVGPCSSWRGGSSYPAAPADGDPCGHGGPPRPGLALDVPRSPWRGRIVVVRCAVGLDDGGRGMAMPCMETHPSAPGDGGVRPGHGRAGGVRAHHRMQHPNYDSLGRPFTFFVPLQLNTGPNLAYADRLPRLARYGEFNLIRARPSGAPAVLSPPSGSSPGPTGTCWFQSFQLRLFEDVRVARPRPGCCSK